MRKHILFTLLIAVLLLFSSCQTELRISYVQPSNVNMASYRNIAIASTTPYSGTRESIPLYIRYIDDIFDPSFAFHYYYSTYNYDSVNNRAAKAVTNMLSNVFSSSSYYSTLSTDRTDTYISLYKVGRDPSAMLREDGVDALIVPRITSLRTDEYIDTDIVEDKYTGEITYRYTLYRYVSISFSLTVLDTKTNRIVTEKTYHTENTDWEVFDPDYYIFYSLLSEEDLVYNAVMDKMSEVISDFVPTKRSVYVTLKDNKPKNESVEAAYKAAGDGNLDYALTLFKDTYEKEKHVPSGYNAALILSSQGDLDSAIEILSDIRSRGLDDSEVNRFYSRLQELKRKNDQANEQMKSTSSESQSSVSPYSYLF